jgi:hypothetical protein
MDFFHGPTIPASFASFLSPVEPVAMQCPQCQTAIEVDDAASTPASCPDCGAALSAAPAHARSRWPVLAVFVVLLTVAVVSALIAVVAARQRTAAKHDFLLASDAMDQSLTTIFTNGKLKESESVRRDLLQPYLAYYEKFVQIHAGDDAYLAEAATAQFHVGALRAKLGIKPAAAALGEGFTILKRLKETSVDPQSYPSVQESALKLVPPPDWIGYKFGKSFSPIELLGIMGTLGSGTMMFEELTKEHPEAINLRSDLAGLHRTTAVIMTSVGAMVKATGGGGSPVSPEQLRQQSLDAWLKSRNLLETLIKDQPTNADFKNRLVEALVGAAKAQQGTGARDEAIANYTRALELREQLATVTPPDEAQKKEMASIQRDLERLKAAPVAVKAAPAEAPAAPPAGK